jgi:hypothetical protein
LATNDRDEERENLEIIRLTDAAKTELTQIESALQEITGYRLKSNWNKEVKLRNDPASRGAKPFTCAIDLDMGRQKQEVRWRTLIHEMLHAHSAGYISEHFERWPGWEEGVVEKLQRVLRRQILDRLGVTVEESVFLEEDQDHWYNPYIEALESMHDLLGGSEEDFYIQLLGTAIGARPLVTLRRGMQLRGAAFREVFDTANATLKVNLNLRRRLGY